MIRYAIELLRSLVKDERGQDVLEYAVLGGTIAIGILVGVGLFAAAVNDWFGVDLKGWIDTLSP